jgi:formate dehydrogenase major subunit
VREDYPDSDVSADAEADPETEEARQFGTVCPLCAVGCRLEPGEGARARGVAGPANPNGRLCRKGVGAFDGDEERLTEPAVRQDGSLRAVSWETALDRAVTALQDVADAHGPDALAFLGAPHCTNEENYLLQKLARSFGTNNVDNRARLCHVSMARTLAERVGWPASTGGLSGLAEADVIVVAGANPAERQPVAFNSFVRPAVTAGATLVHVDPVGNRTTRLADVHLAPHPGQDRVVFDLLCARLAGVEEAVDRAFVSDRTRGYESFASSLSDIDTARARSIAGIDSDGLDRVVAAIADADRVAVLTGTGIDGTGATAPGALVNLLLMTGNFGRPGSGLYILRGLANEQGAVDAGCAPDRLPGHQPVSDPDARDRVAAESGVRPPSAPGVTARELLDGFGDSIRGALVVGENLAVSKRDAQWLEHRLGGLDALVVLELAATETTRHADVLLPAAKGTEKDGTITNLERRVQRLHAVRAPPGSARSDFAILTAVGQRAFGGDLFAYSTPADVFDELVRVAPTHRGLTVEALGGTGRLWPADAATDGTLYRETFDTADGRARFGTAEPLPEAEDIGDRLWLVTGGRTGESDDRTERTRSARLNPDDAAARGIDAGESVSLVAGDSSVTVPVTPDPDVRQGTVYLAAAVADPLVRTGHASVALRRVSDTQ